LPHTLAGKEEREDVSNMRQAVRLFLLVEGASFVMAALVHSGGLVSGYQHREATIAESVIAAVLLLAFGLTWVLPERTRPIGIAAQGFALLGTLVGMFTIAIGVGPRTVPDLAYHLAIVVVLVCGLIVAARALAGGVSQHA
jgi:hypothetical protein